MLPFARLRQEENKWLEARLILKSHSIPHTIQRNTLCKIRSYAHLNPSRLKSISTGLDERMSHSRVIVKYESTKILQQKHLQIQKKKWAA